MCVWLYILGCLKRFEILFRRVVKLDGMDS